MHIYQSIRRTDRHNTGAFSSTEQAVGNPYDTRAIEACCVVAWGALCIDVLRLTGDPTFVDELELATYNAILGAQYPSGRWWTYNTPMDGEDGFGARHRVSGASGSAWVELLFGERTAQTGTAVGVGGHAHSEGVNLNCYSAGEYNCL